MWLIIGLILFYLPGYSLGVAMLISDRSLDVDTWYKKLGFLILAMHITVVGFIYISIREKSFQAGWDELTDFKDFDHTENLRNEIRSLKQTNEEVLANFKEYEKRVSALLIENESLRQEDPIAKMKREIKDASK